jgi:O-antigen/teichoic acid export membrane protein
VAQAVNQKPAADGPRLRVGAHWRTLSWAVLDKSLPLWFGLAFAVLVVRTLPKEEFGLQYLASTVLLTVSQLFRSLWLVPLIRFVAERARAERIASTGMALYAGASAAAALLLWGGRTWWALAFDKPDLAAVFVPSACLLAVGSPRDAAISSLEGLRRLRRVFMLDLTYYAVAVAGLVVWRCSPWPRTAVTIQWIQAVAAAVGTIVALAATRRETLVPVDRVAARRILAFGQSFLGSGIGATLTQQADAFVAGRLLDPGGVAAYGAARMLFRAFNMIAQAINQVMMPAVSRLHATGRHHDLRVLFEKSVCFLTLALVPLCGLLIVATGPLLDLLFHGRYAASVPVFQILVAGALTLPLASVGSPFLVGLGRLRTLLWITWSGLGLGVGLMLWWIPLFGPRGAAAAASAAALYGMVVRAVVLRPAVGFSLGGIATRTRDASAFARKAIEQLRSRSAARRPPNVQNG